MVKSRLLSVFIVFITIINLSFASIKDFIIESPEDLKRFGDDETTNDNNNDLEAYDEDGLMMPDSCGDFSEGLEMFLDAENFKDFEEGELDWDRMGEIAQYKTEILRKILQRLSKNSRYAGLLNNPADDEAASTCGVESTDEPNFIEFEKMPQNSYEFC